jgi:hypothetical protein
MGGSATASAIDLAVEGDVRDLVIQATPGEVVSLLTLSDARLSTSSQPDSVRTPALPAALARGIVVERTADGSPRRVRLSRDADVDGVSILRAVVDAMTTVIPAAPGATWTSREPTSEGARSARYERTGDTAFLKHVAPTDGAPTVIEGELRGALDASGLVDLAGEETHQRLGPDRTPLVRAEERISAHRTRVGSNLARALEVCASLDEAFGPWIAVDAPLPPDAGAERKRLERVAGGRSLADFESMLARVETDPRAEQDLQQSLWAYILLHPEAAEALTPRLLREKLNGPRGRVLVGALTQAGSPEAQRALVEAADHGQRDRDGVATVLGSLGSVAAPTMDTEAYLRAVHDDPSRSDDLGRTAEVALGNVAAHLRDSDPSRADDIALDLATRLRTEKDPAEAAAELAALGNARSDRVTELAPALLHSEDVQVRRMTAFALGRVGTDAARALIEQMAESDPDPSVRKEASRALGG